MMDIQSMISPMFYPLANVYKKLWTSPFFMVNQLFLWQFSIAFCMFTRGDGVFTPWRPWTTLDAQVPLQEQPPRSLRRLAHVRPRSPSLGAAGEVVNGERAESDWWGRHPGFVEGIYWDFMGFTLWLFNIAMENYPFIDGLPIENCDFPWLC